MTEDVLLVDALWTEGFDKFVLPDWRVLSAVSLVARAEKRGAALKGGQLGVALRSKMAEK